MKSRILILLLISLLLNLNCLSADNYEKTEHIPSITDSDNAFYQFDLPGARKILTDILNSETANAELKAKVLRKLATQDWQFFRDSELARNRLNRADSLDPNSSGTFRILSKITRESGNYKDALVFSRKSIEYAKTQAEKNYAIAEFAQSVYDNSVNDLKASAIPDSCNLELASLELQGALMQSPGSPDLSRLLLGISILRSDGEMAINAWLNYFHFESIEKTSDYLKDCAKELSVLFPGLDNNSLNKAESEQLAISLGKCRLYNYAALIATNFYSSSFSLTDQTDEIQDIIKYSRFQGELTDGSYAYYRKIALGGHKRLIFPNRDVRQYKKFLRAKREELWNNLSFIDREYKYTNKKFLSETEKHFGAKSFSRSTGLFIGCYLFTSHIINQESLTVNQHGYTADLIKTSVGLNSCLDYASWFFDSQTIGGWAKKNEIIHNKEAYLKFPIRAWNNITDSVRLKETKEYISNNLYHPDQLKQGEALSQKLTLDTHLKILAHLEESGRSGFELQGAFIAEYDRILEEIVFIHEARHAIEKNYIPIKYFLNAGEREFRAKLSQITLSSEPKLGLESLVNDIASGGGHGKANRKIVKAGIEWLEKNYESVEGFSTDKATFPQLFLLTDEQVRECYLSVDPFIEN